MRLRHLLAFVLVGLVAACGGGNKDSVTPKTAEGDRSIDADPIALLPSSATMLARIDAKQMFESGSVGGQLASMAEREIRSATFKPPYRDCVPRPLIFTYKRTF